MLPILRFLLVVLASTVFLDPARAAVDLTIQLRDAVSGMPTAARLYVQDSTGFVFDDPDPFLYTRHLPGVGHYVHVEGQIVVPVEEGDVQVWAVRGLTGIPVTQELTVSADQTLTVSIGSWIESSALGWIGADPHVHTDHGGEYPDPSASQRGLIGRAEGLDLFYLLDNDAMHPGGRVLPPEPGVEMEWGEEYRNSFWGHMIFLDLPALVLANTIPGCCNYDASAWPSLEYTLGQHAVPLAILAHPMSTDDPASAYLWPGVGYARELYALALTNLVDGIAVLSESNAPLPSDLSHYLDALRAGARWAAIGETDAALDRIVVRPPGGIRTFALAGPGYPATPDGLGPAWRDAVKALASFATTGPFLERFEIDGTTIGGELDPGGPSTLTVELELESYEPLERVSLHGATGMHWEQTWPGGVTSLTLSIPIDFFHDDFVLVEAEGPGGDWYSNLRGTWLVSSPIWIEMGDPWPALEQTGRRGADTLPLHWQNSLEERGYDTQEDSLAMWSQFSNAAAAYEAMFDDPPQPFDLLAPPDGAVLPTASAFLSWQSSQSLDGELTSYTIELDDLDDAQPSTSFPATLETTMTLSGLVAGHRYRWRVFAEEPGEAALPSESTWEFEITNTVVGVDSASSLRLGPPQFVEGSVEFEVELERASSIELRWIDVRGRVVEQQERRLPSGRHLLRWPANDTANGVYWLLLTRGEDTLSRRLLLLR